MVVLKQTHVSPRIRIQLEWNNQSAITRHTRYFEMGNHSNGQSESNVNFTLDALGSGDTVIQTANLEHTAPTLFIGYGLM